MSIIYDALKKVEKSASTGPNVKTDKHRKLNFRIYLLYALLIGIGFFVGNIIFGFFTKSSQMSTKVQASTVAVAKNIPGVNQKKEIVLSPKPQELLPSKESGPTTPPKTQPQPTSPSPLVLTGVFFSEDEGYALINNRIVKVGDTIEGAKVVQITLDGVELEAEGLTLKLSTSK